jgi:starch synthase (maltosyl-transferring)
LPEHLQHAGRASFSLRLVLAATLSSNYGIYGPAFELMENVPRPGVEEYIDNEKYELKAWDVERADSLRPLIARINAIRKGNPALQQSSVSFHETDNELLLCFSKRSADGQNVVLVVANMDVHHPQVGWVDVDVRKLSPRAGASGHRGPSWAAPGGPGVAGDSVAEPMPDARELQLHDLLSDARYFSQGRRLYVRLDPATAPAHIFRLRRRARTENDFDYFM